MKENQNWKPFRLYVSDAFQDENNCLYRKTVEVTDLKTLKKAVSHDYTGMSFRDGYRNNANWLETECIIRDVDNTHSDNPADWITAEDVRTCFPGVSYAVHYSRNHMKEKNGKAARPKMHLMFPPSKPITDKAQLGDINKRMNEVFPFSDEGAEDPARFMFGTDPAIVEIYPGDKNIDDFLAEIAFSNAELQTRNSVREQIGKPIPEGMRHTTLVAFARAAVKRYGVDEGYEIFQQRCEDCETAFSDTEAEQIWKYAVQYHNKEDLNDPNYISPDQYSSATSGMTDEQLAVWKKLDIDAKKRLPRLTTENFIMILRNDPFFNGLAFDEMRMASVVRGDQDRLLTDSDDSIFRNHIEKTYGLYHRQKLEDAVRIVAEERKFHPVRECLDLLIWDGKEHIRRLFPVFLGCEDTPYVREVARLVFAGLSNRIYHPGCKYDYTLCLIGPQGSGKTTFCQEIALEEGWYTSLKSIHGQRALEGIRGKIVVELEEMVALVASEKAGTKIEDAAKAFLSGVSDYQRLPYDKRPIDIPRVCVFIITTNRDVFTTDKTGNRRYLPIRVSCTGEQLYAHLDELKAEIRQCYAEMVHYLKLGDPFAGTAPRTDLLEAIRNEQADIETDDGKVGLIRNYLDGYTNFEDFEIPDQNETPEPRTKVCLLELWVNALHFRREAYDRKAALELGEILVYKLGWKKGLVDRFPPFGQQKSYVRPETDVNQEGEIEDFG